MTFTLDLSYAQPDTQSQLYPALQADNYQPKLKDKVSICLSEDSFLLLSEDTKNLLEFELLEAEFKGQPTDVFKPKEIRLIPLAMPLSFCFHKESQRYRIIAAGVGFKGNGLVSASKIHFCAVSDKSLLLDDDGQPQIFTLNLKSSKTQLIKPMKPVKGDGSLFSWNEQMKSEYKAKGWLLHLFGFKLSAKPQTFTSASSGESSVGIIFELTDPQPIAPEHQKLVTERLQDPILKESIKNPYKIGEVAPQPAIKSDGHLGYEVDDFTEIPY